MIGARRMKRISAFRTFPRDPPGKLWSRATVKEQQAGPLARACCGARAIWWEREGQGGRQCWPETGQCGVCHCQGLQLAQSRRTPSEQAQRLRLVVRAVQGGMGESVATMMMVLWVRVRTRWLLLIQGEETKEK